MKIAGHEINNWVIVGGAIGVVLVIVIYKKSANSSANSNTTSTGTDPLTGLPYSQDNQVDPVTGMTYLQETQQYGSVSAAEAAVSAGSGYGSSGGGYSGTAGYPAYGYGTTASTTSTSYETNAAWAQAVQQGLTALGYSSTDVASALGLYLNHMALPTLADGVSSQSIVQAAVAEYGTPPVGSFSIIPASSSGGSTGNVKVPNVVGLEYDQAGPKLNNAGLKLSGGQPNKPGSIRWVVAQSPKAGTSVADGSTVTVITEYGTKKNPYPPG